MAGARSSDPDESQVSIGGRVTLATPAASLSSTPPEPSNSGVRPSVLRRKRQDDRPAAGCRLTTIVSLTALAVTSYSRSVSGCTSVNVASSPSTVAGRSAACSMARDALPPSTSTASTAGSLALAATDGLSTCRLARTRLDESCLARVVSTGCQLPVSSLTLSGADDCRRVRLPSGFSHSSTNIDRLTTCDRSGSKREPA